MSAPRAEPTVLQRDSILSERANAGVTKKQSKPKSLTRAQRKRQQKGMDRAEMVIDQLEVKVNQSVKRGKAVQARRVCVTLIISLGLGLNPDHDICLGRLGRHESQIKVPGSPTIGGWW